MSGANGDLDLVLAAGAAKSREEFLFLLLNRSVAAVPYDRASAWDFRRAQPALLAVSGNAAPDPDGAFAAAWGKALATLRRPEETAVLGAGAFADEAAWRKAAASVDGLSAVLAVAPEQEMCILFERWENLPRFSDAEKTRLDRLVRASSLAWRGGRRFAAPPRARRRALRIAAAAALLAALVLVRLPLRIAAECEVIAQNPLLVAAPMDGILAEVLVDPGQRVAEGDILAAYDSRMMEEDLNILRRQVGVAEAELATARARGFAEQSYRAETARLEARLEQERARLRSLETRYERRLVAAPEGGMVQLDDPRAWRGRPVATGEALLLLVDPARTRLRIWLPQDDRIDFDPARPAGIHLHALGGARAARLTYVSSFARPTGDGRYAFPAEAEWEDGDAEPAPPLGLRGTAFLYGEEVSLGYWLLRRPLGWLRRWAGV